MTTLKHDDKGFLVGELISGQREMLEFQQTSLNISRGIRSDVRTIARFLGARTQNSAPAAQPAGRSAGAASTGRNASTGRAATPQARDTAGRFVATVRPVSPSRAREERRSPRSQTSLAGVAAEAAARAVKADRDTRGRFRPGGGANPNDPDAPGVGVGAKIIERLGGLRNALQGATQGTEQVDPAIAAVHEVKDVVAPLGRGLFAMFGRTSERKKERWYKRLLSAITGKKDQPQGQQPGINAEQGLGIGAVAGGVARFLPLILSGLVSVLGVGLAGLLGTKIGGAIYDWLDKSGIATKVFDAFDAARNWIQDKVGKAKAVVNEAATSYVAARDIARSGGLDASGRMTNDPRRLDAPGGVSGGIGRIVGSFHRGRDYMAGAGGRTAIQNRALETASKYGAGNIGGLNDAQTRALVASTVATESAGGKLGLVNSAGYMGRYQAGAGWLADAGLIKGGSESVKAAMRADGFTNEYKWGQSGGMTKFLKNSRNWNNGLSYDKYLADAQVQDSAFKTNSDKAYADMLRRGMITSSTPPAEVAGLLKARHLAGMGGAAAVAAGGTGPADANGTTARKYFDDVAKDRGGYLAAFSGSATAAGALRSGGSVVVPSTVPDKLPAAEAVVTPPPAGPEKDKPVRAVMREPIGQDVGDRNIAHIVSGGIGA